MASAAKNFRTGLILTLLGGGCFVGCLSPVGGFGPCGPNQFGLICMFGALLLPIGCVMTLVSRKKANEEEPAGDNKDRFTRLGL